MENSRVSITVLPGVFTNVYTNSSIAVGSRLGIQNQSAEYLQIFLGTTPTVDAGVVIAPWEFFVVPYGTTGCFVRVSSGRTGLINVIKGAFEIPDAPIDERILNGLKAFTVQTFTEANVKNSAQYELCATSASVASNGNLTIAFTTGSKYVLVKNRQISFTGSEISSQVLKGAVFTGGTTLSIYNMNTDTLTPTLCVAKVDPVISAPGVPVGAIVESYGAATVGNKDIGTFSATGLERVLAPNTTYTLVVTNKSIDVCKMSIFITYYEGELSSLN